MTENVRDYPRPPRLERTPKRIRVVLAGTTIADTVEAWRVLETFHPPTYYLPEASFAAGALVPATGSSFCEWKGRARYFDVTANGTVARRVAWSYPDPSPAFAEIAGHVALYAGPMDACWVGEDRVTPQPGGFYGGWITPDITGPIKGAPGTEGW
ncbi:DUF427 domain-containing protein [Roseomonas sp. CCTCC AB2023176]|uniref:DUF427 domain-containing protein n=1 Tax=Roseomonas sp. CCTCC AB2023176 TaxID=3342640 RepID=UPI0035DF1380